MKFPGQESSQLEFKESWPQNNQIIKTIVAFSNSFGGRLVIGVRDDGEVIGIDEQTVADMLSSLPQAIYQSSSPPILPVVYSQRLGDKVVVIIEVAQGLNKPYFLSSKGMLDGTYIRLADHTCHANPESIEELKWQAHGLSVDKMPVYQAKLSDLDQVKFSRFLQRRKKRFRIDDNDIDKLLSHYGAVIQQQRQQWVTVAGILLFSLNPQQYLSESFIIASHFKGTSGREVVATRDITGDLFQQFIDCEAFIVSRLNSAFNIDGNKREEQLELPEVALREILINAIVHRDYNIAAPTKVAIYDDRIEIFSPGGFPGPLDDTQLEKGLTYIRNHVICRAFREVGYIEKLGSGFLTLFASYRERGLPVPQVIETRNYIKCILPRPNKGINQPQITDYRQQAIERLLLVSEEITTKDVMSELAVSRQTAARIMNDLIAKGAIVRVGKGAAIKYRRP